MTEAEFLTYQADVFGPRLEAVLELTHIAKEQARPGDYHKAAGASLADIEEVDG